MADHTELARVLNDGLLRVTIADLERQVEKGGWNHRTMADAARLLRALAADFDEYADHGHTCKAILTPGFFAPDLCDCGYAERVEKWRLE